MNRPSSRPADPLVVRPKAIAVAGVLLAVEGIDGAGKTTQVQMLADALATAGESPVTSKEPTNGRWGRRIKSSADDGRLSFVAELLAFVRDRREHVRDKIGPALAEGRIVLLDRYFYSTIAYQGARLADRSDRSLERLDRLVSRGIPRPRMVFVLDVPPRVGIQRISESRGERPNEFEQSEALERSRRLFKRLCQREPRRLWEIDGTAPVADIHRTILSLAVGGALRRAWGAATPTGAGRWEELRCALLPPAGEMEFPALLSPRRPDSLAASGD